MKDGRIANAWQDRFAEELIVKGKRCVLAKNGELEFLFNQDNASDIVWARYKGVNLSFLSKNGLNGGRGDFFENFEGGFLYTCGLDNVSSCVSGRPIHGSLHYRQAENVRFYREGESIVVSSEVRETALFGKNLLIKRKFTVSGDSLTISDEVVNEGFTDAEYVLLYHINYGYPFLNEDLFVEIPALKSEPLTEIAKKRMSDMFKITSPVNGGDEDVYYHTLSGDVRLYDKISGIEVKMSYSAEDFPVTLEWKSMISGDYALGIEPSLTRFDDFKTRKLCAEESRKYEIKISFKGDKR